MKELKKLIFFTALTEIPLFRDLYYGTMCKLSNLFEVMNLFIFLGKK